MIISKSFEVKWIMVLTCFLFINFDLVGKYDLRTFATKFDTFIFIATVLLPIISRNILCTYLSYKVGYKPAILYTLITVLFAYLLPIIPNPNQYIYSIIWLILPLVLLFKEFKYFTKEKHDLKIERDYHKRKFSTLIIPFIIIIVLVYFVSGYFKYHAVVIASGSMENTISKGDVVIIK